jgi:hypothetical protein
MQEKSASSPSEKSAPELAELVESQKALIASQQNFIRMQQHMMAQHLLREGKGEISVNSMASEAELAAPAGEAPMSVPPPSEAGQGSLPGEGAAPGSAKGAGGGSLLSRHGLSVVLPLALAVLVVVLLFSGPNDAKDVHAQLEAIRQKQLSEEKEHQVEMLLSSDQIKQLQEQLVLNQSALTQTQAALAQTQDALKAAQAPAATGDGASAAVPSQAATPAPATKTAAGDEAKELQVMRENLASIRNAIAQNDSEYLQAAQTLARNRSDLAAVMAQLEAKKGGAAPEGPVAPKKPVEEYLPEAAKRMIEAQAKGPTGTPSAPKDIGEASSQIIRLNKELLAAEVRLRKVGEELGATQTQLGEAVKALAAK